MKLTTRITDVFEDPNDSDDANRVFAKDQEVFLWAFDLDSGILYQVQEARERDGNISIEEMLREYLS